MQRKEKKTCFILLFIHEYAINSLHHCYKYHIAASVTESGSELCVECCLKFIDGNRQRRSFSKHLFISYKCPLCMCQHDKRFGAAGKRPRDAQPTSYHIAFRRVTFHCFVCKTNIFLHRIRNNSFHSLIQ